MSTSLEEMEKLLSRSKAELARKNSLGFSPNYNYTAGLSPLQRQFNQLPEQPSSFSPVRGTTIPFQPELPFSGGGIRNTPSFNQMARVNFDAFPVMSQQTEIPIQQFGGRQLPQTPSGFASRGYPRVLTDPILSVPQIRPGNNLLATTQIDNPLGTDTLRNPRLQLPGSAGGRQLVPVPRVSPTGPAFTSRSTINVPPGGFTGPEYMNTSDVLNRAAASRTATPAGVTSTFTTERIPQPSALSRGLRLAGNVVGAGGLALPAYSSDFGLQGQFPVRSYADILANNLDALGNYGTQQEQIANFQPFDETGQYAPLAAIGNYAVNAIPNALYNTTVKPFTQLYDYFTQPDVAQQQQFIDPQNIPAVQQQFGDIEALAQQFQLQQPQQSQLPQPSFASDAGFIFNQPQASQQLPSPEVVATGYDAQGRPNAFTNIPPALQLANAPSQLSTPNFQQTSPNSFSDLGQGTTTLADVTGGRPSELSPASGTPAAFAQQIEDPVERQAFLNQAIAQRVGSDQRATEIYQSMQASRQADLNNLRARRNMELFNATGDRTYLRAAEAFANQGQAFAQQAATPGAFTEQQFQLGQQQPRLEAQAREGQLTRESQERIASGRDQTLRDIETERTNRAMEAELMRQMVEANQGRSSQDMLNEAVKLNDFMKPSIEKYGKDSLTYGNNPAYESAARQMYFQMIQAARSLQPDDPNFVSRNAEKLAPFIEGKIDALLQSEDGESFANTFQYGPLYAPFVGEEEFQELRQFLLGQ